MPEPAPKAPPDTLDSSPSSDSPERLAANAAIASRILLEVIDQHDFELAHQLIAADYVEHRPNGDGPDGLEGLRAWIAATHKGFPDWRHRIEGVLAQGDRVVVRSMLYGTHTGEFQGIKATGRTIEQHGYDEMRIVDGKMVEHWGEYDWLGFYQQLGVLPQKIGGDQ
jgi:predicted ester cyclase